MQLSRAAFLISSCLADKSGEVKSGSAWMNLFYPVQLDNFEGIGNKYLTDYVVSL
jgi:hypothetical protein